MTAQPQLYCPCLRLGKDGTLRHDDLVAEVTSIRHEADEVTNNIEHSNRFYVCRNHLYLYARVVSDYSIRAIADLSPRQSTFSLGGS